MRNYLVVMVLLHRLALEALLLSRPDRDDLGRLRLLLASPDPDPLNYALVTPVWSGTPDPSS